VEPKVNTFDAAVEAAVEAPTVAVAVAAAAAVVVVEVVVVVVVVAAAAAAVVLLPKVACDEVKLKLGAETAASFDDPKLRSVAFVPTEGAMKLKLGFTLSDVFVDILCFSPVKPGAPNENVTLFATRSLPSGFSSIFLVLVKVAGSVLKPESTSPSPFKSTDTSPVSDD
jgi:hypothetical protein